MNILYFRTKLIQKYHPVSKISEDSKAWWKYACTAILEQNIRPYTWKYIKTHRKNYKIYKETFIQSLLKPNDTELKLDLQKYEDCLTILNIIIAREHAKIELKEKYPDCVIVESGSCIKLAVNCEKIQEICGIPTSPKPNNTNNHDNETKFKLEPLPKYIEKKYNLSLNNWSLSLFSDNREILVATITQFLTSIETQPERSAYKISARAESFVIEGASSENDLIPLVTADNILTGNAAVNFLAIDFEKNPPNSDFNYDINVRLESFEVTYHKYAILEIFYFFKRNKSHVQHLACSLQRGYKRSKNKFITLINSIINRRSRINLKLDIKGPYFVFPDNGSIQEGEHILIIDLGRMTLKTELQAVEVQLEDATLMELEELLYDRIHIVLTDSQMLICHTGDDWRESRSWKDSENHVIPKIQSNVTVSFSIKPDYRLLPKLKLNVSISTLKINLSKHKLLCFNEFLNQLSIPNLNDIEEFRKSLLKIQEETSEFISLSSEQLIRVRTIVALSSFILGRDISNYPGNNLPPTIMTESERSIVSSSEFSEEDLEQWIKSVNYSGFDDNTSPHNHVNLLLRIVIGELCIHACCTSNGREKAYLILRLCTLYLESAIMEYGPVFQLGVGTIVLADKTNAGITGSYLELISTDGSYDIIGVSYRKVRANCPDFKSHFKSIEQSLVFNIRNLNVVFHRQAFIKIKDYCEDLKTIPYPGQIPNIIEIIKYIFNFFKKNEDDPPVPPGAIKLSYSARLHTFVLRLCTKDMDLMEIRVSGLESDCIYNANERMILTAYLRGLAIEDLSEITLYPKILTTEDDKVFDLKYVRHAPKLYSASEISTSVDDVKADGSFKLSFGKINCILLSDIFRDCRHFIEPFIHLIKLFMPAQASKLFVYWSVQELRKSATKLRIFIDFQAPTFLFPQTRDIPNLMVLDLGVLNIENFFKKNEKIRVTEESSRDNHSSILDNILIKFSSITLSRAIMTLAGVLKIQVSLFNYKFIYK